MLVQLGAARSGGADRRLAWSLAGIAGALNAAGFYAIGLYSSNMTGNVSALAERLALADLPAAAGLLAIAGAFVLGAAVSAMLIAAGQRRGVAGIHACSILVEAVLLACLGCVALRLGEAGRTPLLAFGLSFLMGLQNATVTRISDARVRTTHVTGMITDIGIELGSLADLAWHRGQKRGAGASLDRLVLHGLTVTSFLAGGVAGILAYRAAGAWLLLAMAALLLALASTGLRAGRRGADGAAAAPVQGRGNGP